MFKDNHLAVTGLAWALILSLLYLMANYSTILPSQINNYLPRTQSLPGKSITWSVARNCPDVMSDIFVVLKTGGTVTYERLPIHFETTLRCVKNSIIVSDVELEIGDHHTVDVIADLDNETLQHSDFDLYHSQKKFHANHRDLASLINGHNGWTLDKYKFMPAMRRAWLQASQDIDWFLFIEADTAIDLNNLRKMLNKIRESEDPRKTVRYIGAAVFINNESFAHGGSGYLISRHAMEVTVGRSPDDFLKEWGPKAVNGCCGDYWVGRVMEKEANLLIANARPFFQGAKPEDAWYAPDLWCHPVVTMHHMSPQQISELWRFSSEGNITWNQPNRHSLLWKDVYYAFVKPGLKDLYMDWDNGSSDADKVENVKTYLSCKTACLSYDECKQWSFVDGQCSISSRIMLGQAKKFEEKEKRAISGWIMDRVETFEKDNRECKINWDYRG